jgi:hypothetical protein
VLLGAERLLAGFAARPDLRAARAALADSGIAGTEIRYPFFAGTARWLARRWGERLSIDWEETRAAAGSGRDALDESLERLLPLIAHYAETPGLDEIDLGLRGWLTRMAGRDRRRAAALRSTRWRPRRGQECLCERLGLWLQLARARSRRPADTSRAGAWRGAPSLQARPLRRRR